MSTSSRSTSTNGSGGSGRGSTGTHGNTSTNGSGIEPLPEMLEKVRTAHRAYKIHGLMSWRPWWEACQELDAALLATLTTVFIFLCAVCFPSPARAIHYQKLPSPISTLAGAACVTPDFNHPRGIEYVCYGSTIKRWDSFGGRWLTDLISGVEGAVLDIEMDRHENSYFFYIAYLTPGGDLQIDRYDRGGTTADDPGYITLLPQTRLAIVTVEYTGRGNPGGVLSFWADHLTICLWDNGGGTDAQNPSFPYGKIWRIDPRSDGIPGDHTRNYTIPFDNPFDTEVLFYGLTRPRYKANGGGSLVFDGGRIIDAYPGGGPITPASANLGNATLYSPQVDMSPGGAHGSLCPNGSGGDIAGGFYNWITSTTTYNKFIFAACGEWWVSARRPNTNGGLLAPSVLGLPYTPTVAVSPVGWKGYASLLHPGGIGRLITTIADPPTEANATVIISDVGPLVSTVNSFFWVRTTAYVCNRTQQSIPLADLSPSLRMAVYRFEDEGLTQVAALDWNPSPITFQSQAFVGCAPPGGIAPPCGGVSSGVLPRYCRGWIETPAIPFDPSLNTRYILEIGFVEDIADLTAGEDGGVLAGAVRWGSVRFRIGGSYWAEKEGTGAGAGFHIGVADAPIFEDGFESGSIDYFQ